MLALPELIILTLVFVVVALAIVSGVVVATNRREGRPAAGYGTVEARLQELGRLKSTGVITAEEYDARRIAIVGSI